MSEKTAPLKAQPLLFNTRFLLWLLLTTLYFAGVAVWVRRFVWYDELFTFDIARSPTLHDLFARGLHFDNSTPVTHLLNRYSMKLLGETPFGLRFPSIAEFYLGSVALFFYVERKLGDSVACFAVLLLWASPTFYFATEARPYALVLASFVFLLLSWDIAVHETRRRLALAGVAISATVLLAAHALAPFSLLPFLVAEAIRYRRRRVTDYPLWAALVIPMVVIVGYIPMLRVYSGYIVPATDRGSVLRLGKYFYDALQPVATALLCTVLAMLLLPRERAAPDRRARFASEEYAMVLLLLLNPILVNIAMALRHGGFFGRYCITSDVAIYVGIVALFVLRLRPGRTGLAIASVAMVWLFIANLVVNTGLPRVSIIPWSSLRPDLPIVAGNGMTFYEMNHHENPEVLRRLYFLKDRAAALKYQKTNLFQDFEAPDDMKRAGFPITATIEPYSQFVQAHSQFLLDGTRGEWCYQLLKAQGADIALVGEYPHKNQNLGDEFVYLVTMPQAANSAADGR